MKQRWSQISPLHYAAGNQISPRILQWGVKPLRCMMQ
jgi:hypothetical protein